jgi:DNA polymerase I-like protein with 3'-5' exonuclease and polymerase domains
LATLQDQQKAESQADRLIRLMDDLVADVSEQVRLWHTPERDAWVTVPVGGHRENWPIRSDEFKEWLSNRFYNKTKKTPNVQALADATSVLRGKALFESPENVVHTRCAPVGSKIYIDLADAGWCAIEIDAHDWRVISDPPVRFRRARGMLPLPIPEKGGTLNDLWRFVNVVPADRPLVAAWLVAAARPEGPYPILIFRAVHGSGKTFAHRCLRALFDPNTTPLRSMPHDERDLAISAKNGAVLSFDNISRLPDWLSDALCRIATGGSLATRKLFKDDQEELFDFQRPIIINGITEFATQPDFVDRLIATELQQPRPRAVERKLKREFSQARPRLLGALLEALSIGLRRLDQVTLPPDSPRMADFVERALATEPAWRTDQKERGFLEIYQDKQLAMNTLALEASVLTPMLIAIAEREKRWTGTTKQLLGLLSAYLDEQGQDRTGKLKEWPKTPRALSNTLRRLAPNLPEVAAHIQFPDERARPRVLTVTYTPPPDPDQDPDPNPEPDPAPSEAPELDPSEAPEPAHTPNRINGDTTVGTSERRPEPENLQQDVDFQQAESPTFPNSNVGNVGGTSVDAPMAPDSDVSPDVPDDAGNRTSAEKTASRRGIPTFRRSDVVAPHYSDGGVAHTATTAYVTEAGELAAALVPLHTAMRLGLDLETTGLDPQINQIRLLQLSDGEYTVVVDCFAIPDWPDRVRPLLINPAITFIGHHLQFDIGFLMAVDRDLVPANLFDTELAARLLTMGQPEKPGLFRLASLVERTLGLHLNKEAQTSDWSATALNEEQLRYAAQDAQVLPALAAALDRQLADAGLSEVAALEFAALPAITQLTIAGAPFDTGAWQQLADDAVQAQRRLADQIRTACNGSLVANDLVDGYRVNLESTKQVQQTLHQLGVSVPNTQEATLVAVADQHPVVPLILAYREASKRASTYGNTFLAKHVHRTTGRIHAAYRPIGAATGRMSSRAPNLQNIPRSPAYRACFRPPNGRLLVKADLSQIELCVVADLSGDRRMLDALVAGEDLHRLTAAALFQVPADQVTADQRSFGKTVNFGALYGQGRAGLIRQAAQVGISLSDREAEAFQSRFRAAWPDLGRWQQQGLQGNTAVIRTASGRLRWLNPTDPGTIRVNSPVQGTAADGFKAGLAELWRTRATVPSAVPVLAVHDEVVIECDRADVERAAAWLQDCLVTGMRHFLTQAPVRVDVTNAIDWSGTPVTP